LKGTVEVTDLFKGAFLLGYNGDAYVFMLFFLKYRLTNGHFSFSRQSKSRAKPAAAKRNISPRKSPTPPANPGPHYCS